MFDRRYHKKFIKVNGDGVRMEVNKSFIEGIIRKSLRLRF